MSTQRESDTRLSRRSRSVPSTAAGNISTGSMATPRNSACPSPVKGVTITLPSGRVLSVPEAPATLFENCSDDDPAVVFDWLDDALQALLPILAAQAPPPAWFPVVPGVANTIANLKASIIAVACVVPAGAQAHHGRTVIAPLTLQASLQVVSKISYLNCDPSLVAAYAAAGGIAGAIGPLAVVYFIRENSQSVTAVHVNTPPPLAGGVHAFR